MATLVRGREVVRCTADGKATLKIAPIIDESSAPIVEVAIGDFRLQLDRNETRDFQASLNQAMQRKRGSR